MESNEQIVELLKKICNKLDRMDISLESIMTKSMKTESNTNNIDIHFKDLKDSLYEINRSIKNK